MIDITAQALQDFLAKPGDCYRSGCRYLVGDSSLIPVAAKVSTLDIDFARLFTAEQLAQVLLLCHVV